MPLPTISAAPSAVVTVPGLNLKDKEAAEHLKKLEPFLLDRNERKRASAAAALPKSGPGPIFSPSSRRNIKSMLPPPPHRPSSSSKPPPTVSASRIGIRRFIRTQIHLLTFYLVHVIFSLYIRFRQAYHAVLDHVVSVFAYHHNTPELIQRDVRPLKKLPNHISVVLRLEDHGRGAGLETLVNEVADIAAWCASAGIPVLSVYEKTGILKSYLPETHRVVSQKLSLYFGHHKPALSLGAPNLPSIPSSTTTTAPSSSSSSSTSSSSHSSSSPSPPSNSNNDNDNDNNDNKTPSHPYTSPSPSPTSPEPHPLQLLLLSAEDGRDSIVDLTRTLAEMSQRGKLSPQDISVDVIEAELKEGVVGEPDLLVVFGPYPDLAGYPPWQLRLTEIFSRRDSSGVGYQVFLKALYKYANAEMRWGR